MRLYKYTSASSAAFLSQHALRFSPPVEFNDPFDGLSDTLALEKMPAYINCVRGCEDPDKRAYLLRGTRLEGKKDISMAEIESEAKRLYIGRLQADLANFGVLCLSTVAPDETAAALMWGHYATETVEVDKCWKSRPHAGVVFEFDSNNAWFTAHRFDGKNGCHYEEVRYLPRRPSIDEDKIRGLFVKSEPCTYEKEVRLVRCKKGFPHHANDIVVYPPGMLRSVTLGYRASTATLNTVMEELNKCAELGHVEVFSLELDPDEYRFRRVKVARR